MDRRQFLKKAGLAGGLSAAGVVTFKRAYVKLVIQMLEPKYAEALTPVLSVTLSQLGGNSIKAGGGGIFTVGVWTIDVPLSAPIPADLEIRFGVDYFSVSDDGVVSGAGTGMPPGTETFEAPGPFQTCDGQHTLFLEVGTVGTSRTFDCHGDSHFVTPADQPKLCDALDEIACAPPGGAPNDACRLAFRNTLMRGTVLDVYIPETALAVAHLFLSGDRP